MKRKRFYRRADHRGVEAGRGRSQDRTTVPPGGYHATDVLSLESQVRRHEGFRRQTARYLVERRVRSERRACELVGICRTMVRYQAKAKGDDPLRTRLRQLAMESSVLWLPNAAPHSQERGFGD